MKKFLLFFTFVLLIISSTAWSMDEHENQKKGGFHSRVTQRAHEVVDKHIAKLNTCKTALRNCSEELIELKICSTAKEQCQVDLFLCKEHLEEPRKDIQALLDTWKTTLQARDLDECSTAKERCHNDLNVCKERLEQKEAGYQAFKSSFLMGAVYSVIPEFVRDAVKSRGYSPTTARFVAELAQGGLIVLNTSSYVPMIAGIVVRKSCDWLLKGEFPYLSAAAGSGAAVFASVVCSQEPAIYSVTNCCLAMLGSTLGSTIIGSTLGSTITLAAKSLWWDAQPAPSLAPAPIPPPKRPKRTYNLSSQQMEELSLFLELQSMMGGHKFQPRRKDFLREFSPNCVKVIH